MNHQVRTITGNLVYKPAINTAKNDNRYATVIIAVSIRLVKADGTVEQRPEYYLFNIWGQSQVEALSRGEAGDDFTVSGIPQIREKIMDDGSVQENLELNVHYWNSHAIAARKSQTPSGTASAQPGSVAPQDPNAASGNTIADAPF